MLSQNSVIFNTLKHHTGAIAEFVNNTQVNNLSHSLKLLGNSQMDLYYGALPVNALIEEVLQQLSVLNIDIPERYYHWLLQKDNHQLLTLSDTSVWVLLKGLDDQQYIHIHPARYSPHTLRVTANVLKTVVACGVCIKANEINGIDTEAVNYVRKKYLTLSVIRNINESESITRVANLLGYV